MLDQFRTEMVTTMPVRKKFAALLFATAWLIPSIVSADEVVCLFKEPDFQGNHIYHDGDIVNFDNIRLNDSVSSLKLYGGARVHCYEHVGFGGRSIFVQDNVGRLGPRLDNRFSSMQFVSRSARIYEYWDEDDMRRRRVSVRRLGLQRMGALLFGRPC